MSKIGKSAVVKGMDRSPDAGKIEAEGKSDSVVLGEADDVGATGAIYSERLLWRVNHQIPSEAIKRLPMMPSPGAAKASVPKNGLGMEF
jgi:hypothetical protein